MTKVVNDRERLPATPHPPTSRYVIALSPTRPISCAGRSARDDDQLLIGSNGGSTAYGFVRGDYISIPFVFAGDWLNEVRVLGRSFEAFIEAVEHGDGW